MTGTANGRDIVLEDLRQICLHKKSETDWWAYSLNFGKLCLVQGTEIQKCSHEILDMIGVNSNEIEDCVSESFENKTDIIFSENKLLRAERELFIKKGIQAWPTLIINNVTFRVIYYIFK